MVNVYRARGSATYRTIVETIPTKTLTNAMVSDEADFQIYRIFCRNTMVDDAEAFAKGRRIKYDHSYAMPFHILLNIKVAFDKEGSLNQYLFFNRWQYRFFTNLRTIDD
ncbi:hypothetical protein ANTRET_LOCUS928 [Anthophora retusa]